MQSLAIPAGAVGLIALQYRFYGLSLGQVLLFEYEWLPWYRYPCPHLMS